VCVRTRRCAYALSAERLGSLNTLLFTHDSYSNAPACVRAYAPVCVCVEC